LGYRNREIASETFSYYTVGDGHKIAQL